MKAIVYMLVVALLGFGAWKMNEGVYVYRSLEVVNSRSIINDQDLVRVKIPTRLFHDSMIQDKSQIVGKFVDPYSTLLKDDIVRIEHVISGDVSSELWLKPDERAVALKSDLLMSLGNTLKPLDVVDISFTHKKFSNVLIKNARVLFLKDRQGQDPVSGVPHVISLLVNKEHVGVLLQAQELGKLSLQKADAIDRDISTSLVEESVKHLYD